MAGVEYKMMRPAAEDGGRELGMVPLLTEEIEIDDRGVTLVFLFPRCEDDGGTVDLDAERRDPQGDARRIFHKPPEQYPLRLSLLEQLGDGPVTEKRYQEVIRAEFLAMLEHGGMVASTMDSIDEDEVFLKVSMGTRSPRLAQIAEYYRYSVPVREDAFERKLNARGMAVPAYANYSVDMADKLEGFRQVDEIRLLSHWIFSLVNLREMRLQGVITGHFPCVTYDNLCELQDWASWKWLVTLPNLEDADKVREYFGEQVAFLFTWFAAYNKYMVILAVVSTASLFNRFAPGADDRRLARALFAVVLVAWIASFNELFKRNANRLKQRWGMKDWDSQQSLTLPSFRPELDGTPLGSFYKAASTCAVVLFLSVFASIILGIDVIDRDLRADGDMRLAKSAPFVVSLLMKVASFAWGKLADKLVNLQNHRTKIRYDDALAWTLASVKLFVALFPFVELAFIQGYVHTTCGDSLAEVAASVYKTGFPSGTPLANAGPNVSVATMRASDLAFLGEFSYENEHGLHCVAGCYPAFCTETDSGRLNCKTTCWENLKLQLAVYYVLQVVSSVVFLLIPIIMTKTAIVLEMADVMGIPNRCRAVLRSLCGLRLTRGADSDSNGATYSLLQYQAKCYATSPYEYGSYGGSFDEDFLDLAIGYTLQACFNQVLPSMAIIGVFAHMLLYRILAYRMLNVTCRPFPYGAEGIGIWQDILDTIATLAVTCNVAISTFSQEPVMHWRFEHQLLFFILAEKALFMIRGVFGVLLADEPEDVVRIEDFNSSVAGEVMQDPLPWASDRHDYSAVDLGLIGSGSSSDEEDPPASAHGTLTTNGMHGSARQMAPLKAA